MLQILLRALSENILVPFATNESYRVGFMNAVTLALFVQITFLALHRAWKFISLPFKPTKKVVTENGPSPFEMVGGCAGRVIGLGFVGLVILAIVLF